MGPHKSLQRDIFAGYSGGSRVCNPLEEVTPLNTLYWALAVVAVIAAAYFGWSNLSPRFLPPHEFAYGASVSNLQELPRVVSQFLALETLDATKTRIEVSMPSGSSGTGKDVEALAAYFRGNVGSQLKKLDTDKQARSFSGQRCPTNFLQGNINIYPLAMENADWYKSIGLPGDQIRPILEIRFMGLRGIFRYLLDTMQHRTGLSFVHLDGEDLSAAGK
jgi:hypothetical protein